MKSKAVLILAACLLQLVSMRVFADNWSRYQQIMSRYYTFDDQQFSKITCLLQVQPLTEIAEKMRQLSSLKPGDLQVSDTLDNYTMTLDKTNGISFNNPTLRIELLSEKGMADPALVKHGIQQTIDGFNTQVSGVDQQLKGLFEVYRKDKPGEITIYKITKTNQGYVIASKQNNMTTVSTIQGVHIHTVSGSSAMSITADSYFKITPIDNKQLLHRFVLIVKQPTGSINNNSTLTYQKLGAILFPDTIQEQESIESMGGHATMPINIHFASCKAE
jgi:hypothetical protein